VCGLSGGVDSTVAAMLIHRAIGDRLTCIFVDNGLLRYDEANQINKRFTEKLKLPLDFVDASDCFSTAARRHRSRAEAQDHRRHVHRRLRDARDRAGRLRLSSAGARFIRM
jgi:GMP synthase PP-ATPase subunit